MIMLMVQATRSNKVVSKEKTNMFDKYPRKRITVYLDQDHTAAIKRIRVLNPWVTKARIIREALTRGLMSVEKEINKQ